MFRRRPASFGQQFTMISTMEKERFAATGPIPLLVSTPARTMEVVVDGIRMSCEAMKAEGVQAAHAPPRRRVGGNRHELRTVLDNIDAGTAGFRPGHRPYVWAGMDVRKVLHDYSDRIVGVHIKDTFQSGDRPGQVVRSGLRRCHPFECHLGRTRHRGP